MLLQSGILYLTLDRVSNSFSLPCIACSLSELREQLLSCSVSNIFSFSLSNAKDLSTLCSSSQGLKGISHFCGYEEFSLLCSPYICKNKSLMQPYNYNCSGMQARPFSTARCWLFVSTNVIRNTCNILACGKPAISRS